MKLDSSLEIKDTFKKKKVMNSFPQAAISYFFPFENLLDLREEGCYFFHFWGSEEVIYSVFQNKAFLVIYGHGFDGM